jgi:hypothetical protein
LAITPEGPVPISIRNIVGVIGIAISVVMLVVDVGGKGKVSIAR